MSDDRQWRLIRVLRWGAGLWLAGHVLTTALLLESFYASDKNDLEIAIYLVAGWGPLIVAVTYFESRAIWSGRDSAGVLLLAVIVAIVGGLYALYSHLG